MKKVVVLFALLFSIYANAQTRDKWALKVGLHYSLNSGNALSVDTYRLYNKLQLGFGAFVWFKYHEVPNQYYTRKTEYGINLSARYTIIELGVFKPYIYVAAGYGKRDFIWRYTSSYYYPNVYIVDPLIIASFGLGTEISLDNSKWSVDINMGYSGFWEYVGDNLEDRPTISVGLIKRFGKVGND